MHFDVREFYPDWIGVVEDPGNICNVHQVKFTEPIAVIVFHNL